MKTVLKSKVVAACLAALFTAIICVVSQVSVMLPFGVPLTFQISAVALCGYLLGVKWSAASVAAYILLGAVGVPVFSGFRGGISTVLGPTGGYIIGFVVLAFFCGVSQKVKNRFIKAVSGIVGVVLCHIWGTAQLMILTEVTVNAAFISVQIGLLIKDIILCIAMLFAALTTEKILAVN